MKMDYWNTFLKNPKQGNKEKQKKKSRVYKQRTSNTIITIIY